MEKQFQHSNRHHRDNHDTSTQSSTATTPTMPQSPGGGTRGNSISQSVEGLHLKLPKRRCSASHDHSNSTNQHMIGVFPGSAPPGYSDFYSMFDLTSDLIEPIPSSLVLYRYLISFYLLSHFSVQNISFTWSTQLLFCLVIVQKL